MSPIRILYCVETMEVAGAEHVMLSVIERLNRDRFEPVVCCLTERGKLADRLEVKGIPVISLGKDPNFDLPVIPKLMKVIRKHQIDIVHTHCWPANAWGRIAARLAGAPVIVATEHSVHTWKTPAHLVLDRWLAWATDRVICVSDAVKDFYNHKARIKLSKLVRIYNGIDLTPFNGRLDGEAKRRELGIEPNRPVVMVIGRLISEKGHRYFLESIAKAREQFPSVLGMIVGKGSLQAELEQMSRELKLNGNIQFVGERDDIPALLQMADLFVLPSLREGFPLVVLEAMAAGKPVIATDVGGIGEAVIDGVTGLVVQAGDTSALTAGMVRLLGDPKMAKRWGQSGRERVETHFSLDAMVRANEHVYETLVKQKGLRNGNF